MTIRYLADEDLHINIIDGLLAREPASYMLDVKRSDLRGSGDPVLLELAAQQGRILISHDDTSFYARLAAGNASPGLFIVPQRGSIHPIIEALLLLYLFTA